MTSSLGIKMKPFRFLHRTGKTKLSGFRFLKEKRDYSICLPAFRPMAREVYESPVRGPLTSGFGQAK